MYRRQSLQWDASPSIELLVNRRLGYRRTDMQY